MALKRTGMKTTRAGILVTIINNDNEGVVTVVNYESNYRRVLSFMTL